MGLLWACAGLWGCRAWARAPGSSASLAAQRCQHFAGRTRGLSPSSGKGPTLPRPSGLSCSFIGGFLPWACCPDPKEAPAFLAADCRRSLLPSWPCCQRPLVPGWLCMRAGASGTKGGPQRSLTGSSACLWERRGWRTLSRSPKLPYRSPKVYPLLSRPRPLSAQ